MKKLLLLLIFAASAAFGQTTTSVTGQIKDLSGANVTSGQVSFTLQPGIDTSMSGTARFTPSEIDCSITGTGAVKALDGVSTCTVTNNTALQPSGTSYKVCIQPQFIQPGSCFVTYATGTTIDVTSQIPTPPLTPAYNLVDTFSNQSIAGNKTFTGNVTMSGGFSFGVFTASGLLTASAGINDLGALTVAGNSTLASATVTGAVTAGSLSVSAAWRDCRQDGTLDRTGTADAAAVLNLCFLNAFINGQEAYVPSGFYNISSANINSANAFGIRVHGESSIVAYTGTNPVWGTVFMCNRGGTTTCVEMEGSQWAEFDHITILQNGCIGSKCVTTPTGIGLVVGRDNSATGLGGSTGGGTGASNNFCFQTGLHIHDVVIANLGSPNNTLNGNRGYVNFYNVGGAENAGAENLTMFGGTQVVLADTNVIAPTGTYYPLATGCPASMTAFTFLNTNFLSDANLTSPYPNIESDNAQMINIINGQFIGGTAAILGKGTSAFNNWNITGQQESTNTPSYFINLAANAVPPRDFYVHVEGGPNTAFVNATSNGTVFTADKFIWNTDVTTSPFTNTATGQVFQGGTLVSGATSISMSNMQMLGSDVFTPSAGRANVAFAAASSGYTLHGNDGITNFGTQFAQTIRQTDAGSFFIIQDAGGNSHFFIAPGGQHSFCSGNGTGKCFLGTNGHISGGDNGIFIVGDGIGGTGKTIVQEASVSTGSIGATTRTEVLLTWGTTMGDTNYKVQCNVQDSTTAAGTQGLTFERIRTLSATQVGAVINNPTAGAITGTVFCTGTHP